MYDDKKKNNLISSLQKNVYSTLNNQKYNFTSSNESK